MYQHYQYYGMHLVWWFIWGILLFWIFIIPYHIPGQRAKKDSPLNLLKKRFALGEIDNIEFQEKKNLLEKK